MPSILALALASPSHSLNEYLFWGVGFTALNKTRKTLIPKEFMFYCGRTDNQLNK